MLLVGAVMLAYDWGLALVAFALAAPLALVLRVVQRHLVAGLRDGSPAQRRDDGGDRRGGRRSRDDPGLRRRGGVRNERRGDGRPSKVGTDSSWGDRVVAVPLRRTVLRAHHLRCDRDRCGPRPGERTDGRGDDRVRLPHLPVPRADRRVHRGSRSDPDRCRRPPPGARGARHGDRAAADGPTSAPAGWRARHRRAQRHVRLSHEGDHDVARRGRAARRRRVDSRRSAGCPRRRDGFRQDDPRTADRPLRRSHRWGAVPRGSSPAVRGQRRAPPTPRGRFSGAVPVRRHRRRQRRVRQAGYVVPRHRGDGQPARARRLDRLIERRAADEGR